MDMESRDNRAVDIARDSGAADAEAAILGEDTLVDRAVSAAMWGIGAGWLAGMMGAQIVLHRRFTGAQLHPLARLYTMGQVLLTGTSLRHVVHPDIDPDRPYMFFQNHVNHLDHCTMYNSTPHFKQGVELEAHFKYPIYGEYMRRRGTIPVSQDLPGLKLLLSRMREEIDAGHSLLVFPEGTRTLDGNLGNLRSGVFRIAQQLKVPIVPVTVTGMYRVMRKGSLMIRPGYDVTVYCDKPIETTDYKRTETDILMQDVGDVMRGRLQAYWQQSNGRPRPRWPLPIPTWSKMTG